VGGRDFAGFYGFQGLGIHRILEDKAGLWAGKGGNSLIADLPLKPRVVVLK
jgi:hypothetical protein